MRHGVTESLCLSGREAFAFKACQPGLFAFVFGFIEARRIAARNLGKLQEKLLPRKMAIAFKAGYELLKNLFRLSDNKEVYKGGHRLWVKGAVPAGDDDGVGFSIGLEPISVARTHGNAAEVQHVEHVGVREFIGEGKPDEVVV